MVLCAIRLLDTSMMHKATVVSLLGSVSGVHDLCVPISQSLPEWLVGHYSLHNGMLEICPQVVFLCGAWFFRPVLSLLRGAGGVPCTAVSLWVVRICCCLGDLGSCIAYGTACFRVGPLVGPWGWLVELLWFCRKVGQEQLAILTLWPTVMNEIDNTSCHLQIP